MLPSLSLLLSLPITITKLPLLPRTQMIHISTKHLSEIVIPFIKRLVNFMLRHMRQHIMVRLSIPWSQRQQRIPRRRFQHERPLELHSCFFRHG
ncbi:hypothetical protein BKA61DRAFT_587648, partial [Leptodontidium sp. MPI-SDFR-AT-0119]